ncbi:hypothetical protein SK128_013206 [Halocaridina rubra]|uniref:Uncharacterized protein n=1 Tax=Halocaridina rubra TaxID=373956 RepID=A0AAN9A2G6_HALRR
MALLIFASLFHLVLSTYVKRTEEHLKFWKYDTNPCGAGRFNCEMGQGCQNPYEYCRRSCSPTKDYRICEMVNSGKLQVKIDDDGMVLTEDFVNLIKDAVNVTSKKSKALACPVFYTPVGGKCVSFFSPAKNDEFIDEIC